MTVDFIPPVPARNSTFLRLAGLLLVATSLAGCGQIARYKDKHGVRVQRAPSSVAAPPAGTDSSDAPSLGSIINEQLQHGHYDEGGRQLHRYLHQHPDDRLAQLMLSQLDADPQRQLGAISQPHVVQAGDSYSTLAQRYLGNARLFVILARYNRASDPSRLLAGQTVRVPVRRSATTALGDAASAVEGPVAAATVATAPPVHVEAAPAEARAARSVRLQKESVALLDSGQVAQGMHRIDQALALDPGLASVSDDSATLRRQVVASCHQRAIVLYRDQKLDPAIALWDRALKIDPGYEPAVAYRARALELKQRLKQY